MSIIRNLPKDERPRERCLSSGPAVLSLRELVAVILGNGPSGLGALGLADKILEPLKSLEGDNEQLTALANIDLSQVTTRGLGEAGTARLVCCLELAKRYANSMNRSINVKKANKLIQRIPASRRYAQNEWLGFIAKQQNGNLGELKIIAEGERDHVWFEPAKLFAPLLWQQSRAMMLIHNHPSGQLRPSDHDQLLTTQIGFLCDQFSIEFLGHWLVHGERSVKV